MNPGLTPTHCRLSALILALAISSCAVPAKLEPVSARKKAGSAIGVHSLHDLLSRAIRAQGTEEGEDELAQFVSRWREDRQGAATGEVTPDITEGDGAPSYRVQFEASRPSSYLPGYFDTLASADNYEVLKLERYVREGVGTPLMARRENDHRAVIEVFYPEEAITRPVTAVLHPGPVQAGWREVRIELLNSLYHETVLHRGERQPLAADFTVSWAAMLERTKDLRRLRIVDPVFKREPSREPRVYLMQEYDPRKEVLLMIHGLLDTPLIWAELSNELWAHERIRERYQVWHYQYNTATPALHSAHILREQLKIVRSLLDPEGDDPAMQSTTVIAHSMGGLVTRGLISEPGDALWDATFTVEPEDLHLTEAERASLEPVYRWDPVPHVKRVIFIAVPHRGADLADRFLGKIGRAIVDPPRRISLFYQRVATRNPGAFSPAYEKLELGKLSSIHTLSPNEPSLQLLPGLPVPYDVKMHSIIGNQGLEGPLDLSTDGRVPYWSSHLPEAESEKVVPADHGVYKHPEAIREIERILLLAR